MSHVQCSVVCSLQDGDTAVNLASWKGHTAVVKLLIENGADISICDKVHTYFQQASLHFAVGLSNFSREYVPLAPLCCWYVLVNV